MNIVHVTAASVGVAALLWWGLFPAELASEQFQALGRLPALLDATATTPALRLRFQMANVVGPPAARRQASRHARIWWP